MRSLTGTRFGRYEVLELLGAGGMGEVYRARDHDLHRDVAIKFLPERFASSPERLARFEQEARTASSLNHPNIITIHEIGVAPGIPPYIVMEFIEGRTLRAVLHAGRLPRRLVLEIATQLADGMAKAHGAGIMHRDLKPENVMVTADGFVKILDFGLAKLRNPVSSPGSPGGTLADTEETAASPDTGVGALLGTAGYMAPEQARSEPADYRADQFAMGVMLYEMATRQRPFRGASVVQTLNAIIEAEPEPLGTSRPDFPPAALRIVARCLAKDAADRYASTAELARELRDVRDRLSDSDSQAGPADKGRDKREARSRWLVVLGLVALVLAALAYAGRERIDRWLRPLPAEMRVAVLPIAVEADPGASHCCSGLQEYLTGRLADLQRFRARVVVVPAAEVLETGARSPSAARRALGATLVLTVGVHRSGDGWLVTVGLSDTAAVRQLRGASRTFDATSFSPEAVVALAAPLLDLELGPEEERRWGGAASHVAAAGVLFAQGLAATPYQQARTALEQVDHRASIERAIDLFNKAIDLDPRYAAAYAGLAEARLRLFELLRRPEDLDLAAQATERALAIDDTRPSAWTTLGMVRSARGDRAGAERAFTESIKRNPAGADAYRELGTAYARAGQPDKAEAAHRKAIALDAGSWAAHNALGLFFARQQRFDEAERAFKRALEIAPANARLLSNLGGIYLYQRRWREAEATLQQAAGEQAYGAALSNLGWLQFRVNRDYAGAARTFERAAAASPRDYRVWKNLGEAYRHAGQGDRASTALKTALGLLEQERSIDPTDPKVLVELGDVHAMLGHPTEARPLLAEARRLAPTDGDVAYTAATAFEAIGDRDAALASVSAAIDGGYDLLEIESDTGLARLRSDPRYAALLKTRGVPKGGNPRN
jgi:Flp pilus assembly protein TadD/predicted Ser/Thr protein kinase/TolB-like protein